tara:strand:- start:729 stop:2006 length:1278 start_codon:yes stop_codon:yes gene_type:complete
MKYSNSILRSSLFTFLICTVAAVVGQTTTSSPYSRYGIGELSQQRFNVNAGFGGAGIALRSERFANIVNPSSLSSLKLIAFEVAAKTSLYNTTSNGQSTSGANAYLNHLSLSMPINDKWGLSFGLLPFSSIGYDYSYFEESGALGSIQYDYNGSGGLNEIYLANGIEVAEGLSLGFKGSFVFGAVEEETKVYLLDQINSFNTSDRSRNNISDVKFDFGVQYYKELSEEYTTTVGLTYALGTDLGGSRTQLIRSFRGDPDALERFLDTALYIRNETNNLKLPSSVGVGISLEKKEKWLAEINYSNSDWANVTSTGREGYEDSQTLSGGIKLLPKKNAYADYLKLVTYSFGARYTNSYLVVNGQQLNEVGINFGLTLPFKKSISSVTIGAEAMRRGKDADGLLQEDFLNIHVGITFNDRWFIKRKYD